MSKIVKAKMTYSTKLINNKIIIIGNLNVDLNLTHHLA